MEDYKVYGSAKVIDCQLNHGDIVGENTFIKGCSLGRNVQINRSNMIVDTSMGDYTYTGMNTVIKHADIGKFCSISWNVSIAGSIHHYEYVSSHPFVHMPSFEFIDKTDPLDVKRIKIGNDVWIGMNSCILPGVKVGDGAVIGSGSVVTKDIPAYAIAVGNPARVIKYRFKDSIIEKLKALKFWDLDASIIKDNLYLFKEEVNQEIIEKIENLAGGGTCTTD